MSNSFEELRDPDNDPYDAMVDWPRFKIGDRALYTPDGRVGTVVMRPHGPWRVGRWAGLYIIFDGCSHLEEVRKSDVIKRTALDELADI